MILHTNSNSPQNNGISKQNLTYFLMRESIINQDFEPGSLLTERGLCSHFSVSRPPVHNAVQQLVSEGLLFITPENKIMVPRSSYEDLQELFEIMELLQIGALEANDRINRQTSLPDFRQALDQMSEYGNSPMGSTTIRRYTIDNNFHTAIITHSANNRLIDSFRKYSNQYALYSTWIFKNPNWLLTAYQLHVDIYQAIMGGFLSDFKNSLRTHYRAVLDRYLQLCPQ